MFPFPLLYLSSLLLLYPGFAAFFKVNCVARIFDAEQTRPASLP
jgi:hypothetical protein